MTTHFPQRTLLGKQPARILLVDLTAPFSGDAGDDFCDVLENLFAVACNFSGPSRIPFFSLMVLLDHPEYILPFSYVKNNFPRIQTAVSDVRSMIHETNQMIKHNPCFDQGLAEACDQYRRQLQSTLQTGGFCHQLEIVIVSCQNARHVQKQVELAASMLDLEHIKRIQVLSISSMSIIALDDLSINNSQSSDTSGHSSNGSVTTTTTGLVEMVSIEPDLLCLQNFFNGWLLDSGTDSEHMHIILPLPDCPDHEAAPVVIKCDLQERVLHSAQLPFYNQFTIHSDASSMKLVFPSTSKAMGMTVPVYRLQVTALVPITSLCDSIVFGMPMIAQPTACWRIDWDDLEKNQQSFRALCHTLVNKDQAMVAQLENNKTVSRNANNADLQPTGHFALIPSSNGTLLVKCLAVQELMLPYHVGSQLEEPTEESLALICNSLDQVEIMECYNPLNHPSNLYQCLKNIGKKPLTQRQQKRPLEHASTNYSNKMVSNKVNKLARRSSASENLEPDDVRDLADTPLSKRIFNKASCKGPKRALYSEAQIKFLPDSIIIPDDNDSSSSVQAFRSGHSNRSKPVLSFPTSL